MAKKRKPDKKKSLWVITDKGREIANHPKARKGRHRAKVQGRSELLFGGM